MYPLSNTVQRRIVSLAQNELHRGVNISSTSSTSRRSLFEFASASANTNTKTNSSPPQCTCNVRSFSSSGGRGKSIKSSPFKVIEEAPGKPKKKKAVPISKTPRGQAAARATMLVDDSTTGPRGIDTPNNTASSSHSNIDEHESQHHLTHFVKGGTPSDPVRAPFRLADYGDDSLYTLILLRHGESEWNSLNKYTGWCDVNLTENGRSEARAAGRLLKENGVEIDHVFTSVLRRAIFTTNMALNTAGQHWLPVTKSWRLNERHYGALQGYNKDTAYQELGIDQELVMEMRRSYDTPPPVMNDDHPYWHGTDRR